MIDGSGSIEQTGPGNFKRELNFVKQIVSAFEVSRDGTHVGIIIFSSDAKVCMQIFFFCLVIMRLVSVLLVNLNWQSSFSLGPYAENRLLKGIVF